MQNHKTVLIVEDSPAQAFALRNVLEREGVHVLHAPDGRAGVTMAQQHVPDAIVMDIQMPKMNGFEACRCLQANALTMGIPVVMFTSQEHVDAVMLGLDLGAIDFIPKDAFANTVLLETLRQLHILNNKGRFAGR